MTSEWTTPKAETRSVLADKLDLLTRPRNMILPFKHPNIPEERVPMILGALKVLYWLLGRALVQSHLRHYLKKDSNVSVYYWKNEITGLYSFLDDIGEKHAVRYAASAEHGFEVFNSVPDASRYVQYSVPLYKAAPETRGRIAYERGPNGQYKFISSGPDQRRSESNCSQYICPRKI